MKSFLSFVMNTVAVNHTVRSERAAPFNGEFIRGVAETTPSYLIIASIP
jgi:hypothetical protein